MLTLRHYWEEATGAGKFLRNQPRQLQLWSAKTDYRVSEIGSICGAIR